MLTVYEESLKNLWDLNNCLETARRKGKEEGFAEGKAEGEAIGARRKNIENARKMKSKGISVDDIAEITGLSAKEIANL